MKKLNCVIMMVIVMFVFVGIGHSEIYYGAWSNTSFQEGQTYCGWWSALAICNTSEITENISISVFAKGNKYDCVISVPSYGIYTNHIPDIMKENGYDPALCIGSFFINVKNTINTHSIFLLHNGTHSYIQQ